MTVRCVCQSKKGDRFTVFMRKVPRHTTDDELKEFFKSCGKVCVCVCATSMDPLHEASVVAIPNETCVCSPVSVHGGRVAVYFECAPYWSM